MTKTHYHRFNIILISIALSLVLLSGIYLFNNLQLLKSTLITQSFQLWLFIACTLTLTAYSVYISIAHTTLLHLNQIPPLSLLKTLSNNRSGSAQSDSAQSISEQSALKSEQSLLHPLIDSLPFSLIILNREGVALYCNPAALTMFLPEASGPTDKSIEPLLRPKHKAIMRRFLARYFKHPTHMALYSDHGMALLRYTGEAFIGKVSLSPIQWQSETAALVLIEDITDHTKIQQELQIRILELEQIRARLLSQTNELEVAKLKADEAVISKGQFLASMSHEIRTPLNAIIGFTHFLLKSPLDAMQRDRMMRISFASDHLLGIINDILDFSKIEAGKMELDLVEFSLREEVLKTVKLFYESAREKGLQIYLHLSPSLQDHRNGDSLRLRQIVTNLMSNAIKFTENGYIKVDVSESPLANKQHPNPYALRICIEDTGIGISKNQANKLFSSFTQADGSTSRKFGGSGLGLSISKALAEMMNGTITLESQLNIGTTFIVDLLLPPPTSLQTHNAPYTIDIAATAEFDQASLLILLNNEHRSNIITAYCDTIKKFHHINYHVTAIETLFDDFIEHQPNIIISDDITLFKTSSFPASIPALILCEMGIEVTGPLLSNKNLWVSAVIEQLHDDQTLLKGIISALNQESWDSTIADTQSIQSPEACLENKLQIKLQGTVLLAEDNINNQLLATDLLTELGISYHIVNNGLEAVNEMRQSDSTYDLILMDIQMPIMDGISATKIIRSEINAEIPILAMTANAMSNDIAMCIAAGMNAHIAKPIDFQNLTDQLAEFLQSEDLQDHPNPEISSTTTSAPPTVSIDSQADTDTDTDTGTGTGTGTEPTELPHQLPGLNIEVALGRLGGRQKLYFRLLEDFSINYFNTRSEIESFMSSGDTDSAQRVAHTMKGLAGSIGAEELQKSAYQLEETIKSDESSEELIRRLEEFDDRFQLAISSVKDALDRRGA